MSKIIVEDMTEKKVVEFVEKYAKDFAYNELPLFIQDGISIGLTSKEMVYSAYLVAEVIKRYALLASEVKEEDFEDVGTWSSQMGAEYMEKINATGLIEKVKNIIAEEKAKKVSNKE